MNTSVEQAPVPDFEIDHPELFGEFMLQGAREIRFYLDLLARQRNILTAYIDAGENFFLTSILALDEVAGLLFLDPSHAQENNLNAQNAKRLTLVTNLDRVKMQIRLPGLKPSQLDGRSVLSAPIPESILRLQRREFFRLQPPGSAPIVCKLAGEPEDLRPTRTELMLSDISGGGICLIAPTELAELFPRDALFHHCRLEIPGEGVIQVNLRVRKTVEISGQDGNHDLRVGCEFVNLPGTRLAFIERYIARIERERKARASGLAD
jgi:c-di-GMP-binding flagellar brake protein YcgR